MSAETLVSSLLFLFAVTAYAFLLLKADLNMHSSILYGGKFTMNIHCICLFHYSSCLCKDIRVWMGYTCPFCYCELKTPERLWKHVGTEGDTSRCPRRGAWDLLVPCPGGTPGCRIPRELLRSQYHLPDICRQEYENWQVYRRGIQLDLEFTPKAFSYTEPRHQVPKGFEDIHCPEPSPPPRRSRRFASVESMSGVLDETDDDTDRVSPLDYAEAERLLAGTDSESTGTATGSDEISDANDRRGAESEVQGYSARDFIKDTRAEETPRTTAKKTAKTRGRRSRGKRSRVPREKTLEEPKKNGAKRLRRPAPYAFSECSESQYAEEQARIDGTASPSEAETVIERVDGRYREKTASTVAPTIPPMLPNTVTVTTTADVHHQPQHYEAQQVPVNASASRQDADSFHQVHQATASTTVPMDVQSQWPQPAQGASVQGQLMRHQFMPIAPAPPSQQFGAPMLNQAQRQPFLPMPSHQEGSAPQPPPPGTEDGIVTLQSIDDVPPPPFPQQHATQQMHTATMAPPPFTGEPQRQVRASAHQPLPPGVGGSAPARLCKVAGHVGLHINPMSLPAVVEHEKRMAEVALTTKRLPFQDLRLSNDYEMIQPEADKPYALTVTYKTDLPVPACQVIGYEKFAPLTLAQLKAHLESCDKFVKQAKNFFLQHIIQTRHTVLARNVTAEDVFVAVTAIPWQGHLQHKFGKEMPYTCLTRDIVVANSPLEDGHFTFSLECRANTYKQHREFAAVPRISGKPAEQQPKAAAAPAAPSTKARDETRPKSPRSRSSDAERRTRRRRTSRSGRDSRSRVGHARPRSPIRRPFETGKAPSSKPVETTRGKVTRVVEDSDGELVAKYGERDLREKINTLRNDSNSQMQPAGLEDPPLPQPSIGDHPLGNCTNPLYRKIKW